MVFVPTIPQGTHKLKISQPQILENNSKLDSIFDVDHIKFSDVTGDAGKHVYSNYVNLTAKTIASPTTSSTELAIYNKDDPSGNAQLFYREVSSGAEVQLTGSVIASANGQSTLPGGLSIKWGVATVNAQTTAVTYITTFGLTDFTTASYSVVATSLDSASEVAVLSQAVNGFALTKSKFFNPGKISWIAIGK